MTTPPNQTASESAFLDEVTSRLTDTIERASLQILAAILHGKRAPFGGPPVDDAVRDAIEIRNQIIKAMSRGKS